MPLRLESEKENQHASHPGLRSFTDDFSGKLNTLLTIEQYGVILLTLIRFHRKMVLYSSCFPPLIVVFPTAKSSIYLSTHA